MISLLVCSRVSGNKNYSLLKLLDSLKRMSASYDNFEVLVKFDSDDEKVKYVLPKLDKYPFTVKYLIEPRGRGYIDLHVFYNRLFSLVDERSVVIGAMGDDFEITEKHWDEVILGKTHEFDDQVYIIHGRPHPPYQRENYETQKFFLDFDFDRMEDLEIIDEAPLWSRKLLDICGGFGHLSFTDVWTLALEYYLWHRCGLNRTIFTDRPFIHRQLNEDIDKQGSKRWWTDRVDNFAFARSNFYKTQVEQQALNIYSYLRMLKDGILPPPSAPKVFTVQIPKLVPHQLSRFDKLKFKVLYLFPLSMRPSLIKFYHVLLPRRRVENNINKS